LMDSLLDNADTISLDNNTNFNWNKAHAIEVQGETTLPMDRFYQQSHYFIDTLKDEFCKKQEGDWFKIVDPVPQAEAKELPIFEAEEPES